MAFEKEDLDQIFETYLKPMNSHNARLLFKILYDYRPNFLTTLDLQSILKKYDQQLNKIELNNWLTTLMLSGLVEKSDYRGKPTTIRYDNRYTYDLWKVSLKGIEIGELMPLLIYTIDSEKIIDKYCVFNDFKKKSLKLLATEKVVDYVKENDGEVSFSQLENKLKLNMHDLIAHFTNENKLNEKEIFSFSKKDETIFERILRLLGITSRESIMIKLVLNC